MDQDREHVPAGSQPEQDSDELVEVVRGQEPYWLRAGRIVEDMRGLLDRIEATIESGTLTHPYGYVVDLLEEDLGEIEMYIEFDIPSMPEDPVLTQNGDGDGEAAA